MDDYIDPNLYENFYNNYEPNYDLNNVNIPTYSHIVEKEYTFHEIKPVYILGINIASSIFWAYLIIILIAAFIIVYIYLNSKYPGNLIVPPEAPSGSFYIASWVFAMFAFVYTGYVGYVKASPDFRHQNLLNLAFGLNIIVGIFWAILFFNLLQPSESMWLIIINILITLWWIFLIWKIDMMAGLFLIIHLIFIAYTAYINYLFVPNNTLN